MKRVAVGSTNPVKIKAVQSVFTNDTAIVSIDAPSRVSAQPFSDDETRQGAIERAKATIEIDMSVDAGIGLEGGVLETELGMMLCNWGALATRSGELFVASGAKILLPEIVSSHLKEGKELGEIMGIITNDADVRKKQGAIGVFTNGLVTRDEMFSHVVKLLIGQYEYSQDR
ncbi:DUF84 family protein [Bacillus sp. FJAT-45350]|uniref:DUF84 family protein n=1 Tax=Bacillus sp. FJAT-45350 TaxID=2011014 RepID=UPI000BB804E0|nr:DUF84 family protein [Bacillus sp. FJAT-45350]